MQGYQHVFSSQLVRNLLFTLLISIGFNVLAIAQPSKIVEGYYLTNEGDTMNGFLNLKWLHSNGLGYKPLLASKLWKFLSPNDLSAGYGINGEVVKSHLVRIDENQIKRVFAERLSGGGIWLYKIHDNSSKATYFFNTIENDSLTLINPYKPQAYLRGTFPHCEGLGGITIRYGSRSLERALHKIRNCSYPGEAFKKYFKYKKRILFGASFTMSRWRPQLNGHLKGDYNILYRANVGLTGKWRFNHRLGMQLAINYLDNKMKSNSSIRASNQSLGGVNNTVYFLINPIVLDFKYLEFPFQLSYDIAPASKLSPFLNVGFFFRKRLKMKEIELNEPFPPAVLPPTPHPLVPFEISAFDIKITRNLPGFIAGIGARYQFGNKSEMEIALRYHEHLEPINSLDFYTVARKGSTIKTQRFELSASYLFLLHSH